ncbi:hypothetical protein TWF730_011151 [Orbilia blumenaviensis]|uniref:F-box domain-containing protein n=1 Tax=Orbilia blumenaviensis TaxID=1796055 RepID=A0AAV9UJV3_9PEZI
MVLQSLSLDIKLGIAAQLTSTEDLISLSQCCKEFRFVKDCTAVRRTVFENETEDNITPQVIALWNAIRLRSCQQEQSAKENAPSKKGDVAVETAFVYETRQDMLSSIPAVSELRRTIRWFTVKFFEHHMNKRSEEVVPTKAEISRVDFAFATLWFWMELSQIEERNHLFLVRSVIAPFVAFVRQNGSESDSTVMLLAYRFIRSKIANLSQLRLDNQHFDRKVVADILQFSPCPTRYVRVGVPNLAMMKLGLNGVRNLMMGRPAERLAQLKEILPHPLRSLSFPYDEEQLYDYFKAHIGAYRRPSGTTLARRPLWSHRDSVYLYEEAVWNQLGLDLSLVIWDDQRLSGWGFCRAGLTTRGKYLKRGSGEWVALQEMRAERGRLCTRCVPSWSCYYQFQASGRLERQG